MFRLWFSNSSTVETGVQGCKDKNCKARVAAVSSILETRMPQRFKGVSFGVLVQPV